jgi:fructokinase
VSLRIGVDLGGTKIEGIALDGSSEVARSRIDTPRDYAGTIETVATLVESLEQRVGMRASVGMGIPGAIDADTGLVKNANSVWLLGKPLRDDLQRRLSREVRVANDANCFAVSEASDGAAAGAGVVFGVIVGTGTGGGLVISGQLVTGANGIAGEWGHNPLPWPEADEHPGPECYCGRRGCIETFLSGPGLTREHERRTGRCEPPPAIVAQASGGDADARGTLARYESRMARALAGIINVVDPDVIVLGGGMSNIDGVYEAVPKLWPPFVFSCAAEGKLNRRAPRTQLVRAKYGDASGVRGAAWLWPA